MAKADVKDINKKSNKLKKSGSNLVAAGILLSRIAGLIREMVIVVVLSDKPSATAFRFAMRFPNMIQNLLGEGALSASFIPVYAKLIEEKKYEKADALAKSVVSLLIVVTTALVLLIVLLARPLIWLFTDWETRDSALYEQTIVLVRITSVGIGFLVISAWCLGILNSHRKFFLSYVAPVIWNFAQITALLVAIIYGFSRPDSALWISWAVVVGGLLQLFLQLPTVLRLLKANQEAGHSSGTQKLRFKNFPELTDVIKRFTPAVGARSIVQLSSFTDTFLAAALVLTAIPLYAASLPLYLLPISLFGFSIAAAELTEMSRISDATAQVKQRLTLGLKKVAIPAGFIAVAYLAASQPIVNTLYGIPASLKDNFFPDAASAGSGFGSDQVLAISLILAAFAIGLPAAMSARVTQNTLYSLGDVKGPAKIAIFRLCTVLVFSSILMLQFDWLYIVDSEIKVLDSFPHWPLIERVNYPEGFKPPPHLGPVGLALGASIAAWTEWFLLQRLLSKRLGSKVNSGWLKPIAIAAVPAGLIMFAIRQLDIPSPADSFVIVGTGLILYYAILRTQKIDPIRLFR